MTTMAFFVFCTIASDTAVQSCNLQHRFYQVAVGVRDKKKSRDKGSDLEMILRELLMQKKKLILNI